MSEVNMNELPKEEQGKVTRQELLIKVNNLIDRKYGKKNQSELAVILDMDQSRVSLLRNRKEKFFSIEKLIDLAGRMGEGVSLELYTNEVEGDD